MIVSWIHSWCLLLVVEGGSVYVYMCMCMCMMQHIQIQMYMYINSTRVAVHVLYARQLSAQLSAGNCHNRYVVESLVYGGDCWSCVTWLDGCLSL